MRISRDGNEVMISASQLLSGDEFIVRPGELLTTDGVIISGETSLNEAAVAGESVPLDKTAGMKVFASSINCQGAITVEAIAAFANNTLSRIIHLVEDAQDQKGKAQKWGDRFGRRYSPVVLFVSLLMLLILWLLGIEMAEWVEQAVVLLVAAAHLEHLGVIKTSPLIKRLLRNRCVQP